MSDSESKSDPSAPPDKPPEEKKSGRVAFDARGNAVWEWEMKTGIFGREVDTKRLKKLEAKDLKLSEEPPSAEQKKQQAAQARRRGFNPYDHAAGNAPPAASGSFDPLNRPLAKQVSTAPIADPRSPPASQPKRTGWLRRLFKPKP